MNINANLVAEPTFSSFEKDGETVEVANFTLVKKYGKGKEYMNCAAYGEKVETAKELEKERWYKSRLDELNFIRIFKRVRFISPPIVRPKNLTIGARYRFVTLF